MPDGVFEWHGILDDILDGVLDGNVPSLASLGWPFLNMASDYLLQARHAGIIITIIINSICCLEEHESLV